MRYIKQHRRVLYTELLTTGKLNNYLADINAEAEEMFSRLVNEMAEKQAVTEQIKSDNQMLWVRQMNNIRNTVTEFVDTGLIYT